MTDDRPEDDRRDHALPEDDRPTAEELRRSGAPAGTAASGEPSGNQSGAAIPAPLDDEGDTVRYHLLLDPGELDTWDAGEPAVVTTLPYDLEAPFTGREAVLDAVARGFREIRDKSSLSLLLLVGPAGMGKSRTLREIGERLRREDRRARVLLGAGGSAPYQAFAQLLARRFRIPPALSPETCQQRILDAVSAVLPATRATDVTHLLAYLMGVPFADSPIVGPLMEAPQQLESRMFIALRRFLAADAGNGPLVLMLDDLDRCGAETIHLLEYLSASLSTSPVLIAGAAQEELFHAYPGLDAGELPLRRIDLAPLSDDEATALVRALCRPLAEVPERLVAHAKQLGGSPRAAMELIRLLIESGIIVRAGSSSWTADAERLAAAALPSTHDELVLQRLTVMPVAERRLLEQAAVVGETFWLDAVVALVRTGALTLGGADGPSLNDIARSSDYARQAVAQALEQLVEREWIARVEASSLPGAPEYQFASPSLRELIYERIAEPARRAYHRTAAQWLQLRPDGAAPEAQEDVARHLERAGDTAAAAACYRRAADAARASFFNDRAIALYHCALSCLGTEDVAARIHIWHDLGSVYELKGDFEAALDAFERMLRLSWLVAARTKAAVALNKTGRVWRGKGDLRLALEHLERAAELFEQTGDSRGIAGSLDDIGQVLYLLGRYDEAYEKITAALDWRDLDGDTRSLALSISSLGNIQKARGRFDEAQRCYQQALEIRRDIGDRRGATASLNNLAVLAWERGDYEHARSGWLQTLDEAEGIGALPLAALALCNLGELALAESEHEEGRRRASEALDIAREIDERRLQAESMRILAQIEKALGDLVHARDLAHRAHAAAAAAGLRQSEARALICLGDVFSASLYDAGAQPPEPEDVPAAQDYYERGIALLRELGDDADLARALERFGRYWIERGEHSTGKDLLREALVLYSKLDMKQGQEVESLLASI